MAENNNLRGSNGQSDGSSAPALPSAGAESALQEWLTILDSDGVAQPFPRSPKLQRSRNNADKPSQVRRSTDDVMLVDKIRDFKLGHRFDIEIRFISQDDVKKKNKIKIILKLIFLLHVFRMCGSVDRM